MKKKEPKQKVECVNCVFIDGKIENLLIGCTNKERNPGGYKVGTWPQFCEYFKQKKSIQLIRKI